MPLGAPPIAVPFTDPATGTVAEVWRIFLRNLTGQVGALAPLDGPYLTARATPDLTAEVNLGALAAGYLKLAVAVGIATPSTVAAIPQADVTGLVAALLALTTADAAEIVARDAAILAARAPRVVSVASSATPTPNADTTDLYDLTAQAAPAAFANPTGTPVNAQQLLVRIKDNGTARALTWGTAYVAGGVALPATTVLSKIVTLTFRYNTANALNKFQCVQSAQEV